MKTPRKLFSALWCLMCLVVPGAHAGFLPAAGQLLLHFDLAGNKGDLLFDDSTGVVSLVPTQVTEVFVGTSQRLTDPLLGLTVTGSGTFSGNGALFPALELSSFVLSFSTGLDEILRMDHTAPSFSELFAGSTDEAFDFGPLEITVQGSLPGSDFLSAIRGLNGQPIIYPGGNSSIIDELTGKLKLHDALAVTVPEPGTVALVALGLRVLWFARRRLQRVLNHHFWCAP